jgi:hypothetical protein
MKIWFLFLNVILFSLSSCVGNFAPITDKGDKYYGKEETKKTDVVDEMLESLYSD